jgi:hypothetical protein
MYISSPKRSTKGIMTAISLNLRDKLSPRLMEIYFSIVVVISQLCEQILKLILGNMPATS